MITSMTKYSFILLKGEKDGFLDRLQELGVVDISRTHSRRHRRDPSPDKVHHRRL